MQGVSPATQYITVILLSLFYVTSLHPTFRLFFPLFLLSLLSLKISGVVVNNRISVVVKNTSGVY